MNLLIPCTSLLCIILIILAAKMLRKLIDESNQKIEISVYQDRIKEMEQHIEDIENLYAGIRGMKHDMKNYIADMQTLNAYRWENMFFIIIKNSFDGIIARDQKNDRLRTTKPDAGNHGLGLLDIEVCAQKYYGKAETTVRDHEFELAVMLQKGAEEKA